MPSRMGFPPQFVATFLSHCCSTQEIHLLCPWLPAVCMRIYKHVLERPSVLSLDSALTLAHDVSLHRVRRTLRHVIETGSHPPLPLIIIAERQIG